MIKNAPGPEAVFPEIKRFIGHAVVVAHNVVFDLGFIRAEMARLGLGFNPPHQCTLQISRRLFPELSNHRLATVARHVLGAIPENLHLHRAIDDARLTAWLWLEMMKNE
jgi:DNA polymerase III epsilon subunit-like protein